MTVSTWYGVSGTIAGNPYSSGLRAINAVAKITGT